MFPDIGRPLLEQPQLALYSKGSQTLIAAIHHFSYAIEVSVAEDIERRKKLTFEQAEGIEPLPSQLQLREISPKLTAALWHRIYGYLNDATKRSEYKFNYIGQPWSTILKDEHVFRQHRMVDEFSNTARGLIQETRAIFDSGEICAQTSSLPDRFRKRA